MSQQGLDNAELKFELFELELKPLGLFELGFERPEPESY